MNRKVALVTGASRGIGRAIALQLGSMGFAVVVNYRARADAAEECLAGIRAAGGDGIVVQADVSRREDRERLVSATLERLGAVDLLVNNAGVAPEVRADILEATEESFDRVLEANLKGPYFLTQRVAREMVRQIEARGSREDANALHPQIVTVSSVSAYAASVQRGEYCVAKAGLSMMTALFASRLAPFGIRVYEIRPGVIATDMTGPVREKYDRMIAEGAWPLQRWGQPEDVARAVAAIARGDLPFSTGEVINVDGGFHLRVL